MQTLLVTDFQVANHCVLLPHQPQRLHRQQNGGERAPGRAHHLPGRPAVGGGAEAPAGASGGDGGRGAPLPAAAATCMMGRPAGVLPREHHPAIYPGDHPLCFVHGRTTRQHALICFCQACSAYCMPTLRPISLHCRRLWILSPCATWHAPGTSENTCELCCACHARSNSTRCAMGGAPCHASGPSGFGIQCWGSWAGTLESLAWTAAAAFSAATSLLSCI